ncbi:hypothetical protein AZE42_10962 [Rhizopogon vesiculosus]|uniref:Uncharacterized protein n=1 Tax=Rhizopogon vesiculosus TaxID=180088 RepID=A0A1J8QEX4_9AGAM|nr:hypothetical protein AZE42_10962 [Rhizopogon vesiculosus]
MALSSLLVSCFPRTNPSFAKFENKDSVEIDGLCNAYNHFAMESLDEYVIGSYKSAWQSAYHIKGKKGNIVVSLVHALKSGGYNAARHGISHLG